jgi:hypothetical protein
VRKVTAVTPYGATTKLSTVPATLFDIAAKLNTTISFADNGSEAQGVSTAAAAKGNKIAIKKPAWDSTLVAGIELEPIFEFESTVGEYGAKLVLDWPKTSDFQSIDFSLGFKAKLGFRLKVSGSFEQERKWERNLMKNLPKSPVSVPLFCVEGVPFPLW